MQSIRDVCGVGIAIAVTLAGCRAATIAPVGSPEPSAADGRVSKDSAVVSIYAGTLPCADCRGIHTTVTLMASSPQHTGDGTFAFTEVYLGTPDGNRRIESRGKWIILRGTPDEPDATVYQLNFDGTPRLIFLRRIGDEALRMLDRDQREIGANPAYTLTRATAPALGGYRSINPADPDAHSAAEYAVSEQRTRTGTVIVLRRIVRADRQVVAGMNYRLCLEVNAANSPAQVEVIVYRDVQQRLSLTRWPADGCGDS